MTRRKKWLEIEQMGQRIREARERLGITQDELAALIGRTQDTISHYETGNRAIVVTELPALAKALKVPIASFFGDNDPDTEALDLMSELKALTPDQKKKVIERWRFELNWWMRQDTPQTETVQEG
jgi:transcriptional regulator with XRE-family HTH domain